MRNDRYELAISPDRITHTLKGNSESILQSEVQKVAEVKNWRNVPGLIIQGPCAIFFIPNTVPGYDGINIRLSEWGLAMSKV